MALLILMAPLLVLVILLIQLESPGSPFYRAQRVGYRGQSLDVLKFRKMVRIVTGLPLTLAGGQRVGTFMTRTRIDELPQLWNVVCGQMSVVGPRPRGSDPVSHYLDAILPAKVRLDRMYAERPRCAVTSRRWLGRRSRS